MYRALKRIFLAALPLAGLLMLPAVVTAHEDDDGDRRERFQNRLSEAHEDYHDGLRDLHREYHNHPSSERSHRRFHRWLNQEHNDFHGDLDNWNDSYRNWYGRGGRGWYQGNPCGWYGNPRYYDNNNYQRGGRYCPPRYYGKSPSNQYPWWR